MIKKAPKDAILPDFIIGGAMKSGTTTLHRMLGGHPDIFLPKREIFFFDLAERQNHPVLELSELKNGGANHELLWTWYSNQFKGAKNKVIGEDSTTYLSSSSAAKNIAIQNKPIKLIFLLRHPTQRTYSHYFHRLRKGKVIYGFEKTLKRNPLSILKKSLYKEQLEVYYRLIPKERIKIIVFEQFVKEPEQTLQTIAEFIDIPFYKFDKKVFQIHANQATVPKFIKLQLFINRWLDQEISSYHKQSKNKSYSLVNSLLVSKIIRKLNPLVKKKPPISREIESRLNIYFKQQLKGIDELTGQDILSNWF